MKRRGCHNAPMLGRKEGRERGRNAPQDRGQPAGERAETPGTLSPTLGVWRQPTLIYAHDLYHSDNHAARPTQAAGTK